jgi:hypothetical protein
VLLVVGAPAGGDSESEVGAADAPLWFVKLLATGPGGLLSLRQELGN